MAARRLGEESCRSVVRTRAKGFLPYIRPWTTNGVIRRTPYSLLPSPPVAGDDVNMQSLRTTFDRPIVSFSFSAGPSLPSKVVTCSDFEEHLGGWDCWTVGQQKPSTNANTPPPPWNAFPTWDVCYYCTRTPYPYITHTQRPERLFSMPMSYLLRRHKHGRK